MTPVFFKHFVSYYEIQAPAEKNVFKYDVDPPEALEKISIWVITSCDFTIASSCVTVDNNLTNNLTKHWNLFDVTKEQSHLKFRSDDKWPNWENMYW